MLVICAADRKARSSTGASARILSALAVRLPPPKQSLGFAQAGLLLGCKR
jgi:hypothetical protein